MQLWFCPLFAFLLGSIPFGLLMARMKGVDIRQHGSGNIGATNVYRVMGKGYGIGCLVLDALKGFVPVFLCVNFVKFTGVALVVPDFIALSPQVTGQVLNVVTALAAVLGHNYSPWIGFKGGKGIATSAGVLIGLMPEAVVILVVVFSVVLVATRYVAVASMACAVALPVVTHLGARFHGRWADGTWNRPLLIFTIVIAVLAIWKHRTNIRRLLDGNEAKFAWRGGQRTTKLDP